MAQQLDYRHRPAKTVQRYMVVDTCRRLMPYGKLSGYQYVGFGGVEFVDFDLIHRALGITDMASIESDVDKLERFRFNRPFSAVRIMPGRSSDVLPDDIDWTRAAIVWLDYTARLCEEILSDAALLATKLVAGSMLIITMNANNPRLMAERRNELVRQIGDERIPLGVTDKTLAKWGLAAVQYQVLSDVIRRSIRSRVDDMSWNQVLNINYADGAMMQTLAAVVAPTADDRLAACNFSELPFCRFKDDPLLVRVPFLTAKERRGLDEQLPVNDPSSLVSPGLGDADKADYSAIYRYTHLMGMPV